jgi:hypothetical protein
MYNLGRIEKVNGEFDETFKLFRVVRVEIEISGEDETSQDHLTLFFVPKGERSLFSKPSSHDDFERKKEQFKSEFERFKSEFESLFDRVEETLSEKDSKSLEVIDKTIDNRKKRLFSAVDKFEIDPNWNLQKLGDEYLLTIEKHFSNVISEVVRIVSNGAEERVYRDILKIFNQFLKRVGVFTIKIESGEKIADSKLDFIEPQECDDCDTEDRSLSHVIKEVISLPYMVDDNRAIADGKALFWRIK